MKKKNIIVALSIFVGSLAIGGGAGAATTAYYIQYMDNMKPVVMNSVNTTMDKTYNQQEQAIYQGTISIAYSKMEDVQKQATQYAVQKIDKFASDKSQENADQIEQHGNEILKDIESQIDQELKSKYGIDVAIQPKG